MIYVQGPAASSSQYTNVFPVQCYGNGLEVRLGQKEGGREEGERGEEGKKESVYGGVFVIRWEMKMSLDGPALLFLMNKENLGYRELEQWGKLCKRQKGSSLSGTKITFGCSKPSITVLSFIVLPNLPSGYRTAVNSFPSRTQLTYGRHLKQPSTDLKTLVGAPEILQ